MATAHGNQPDHKHDGDHAHAGPKLYWIFAIILCVITFIEWIIFKEKEAWGISNSVMIWSLIALSIIKFVMVCGWYMHLRFDSKVLRNIFVFSGLLAFAVFLMMKLALPSIG